MHSPPMTPARPNTPRLSGVRGTGVPNLPPLMTLERPKTPMLSGVGVPILPPPTTLKRPKTSRRSCVQGKGVSNPDNSTSNTSPLSNRNCNMMPPLARSNEYEHMKALQTKCVSFIDPRETRHALTTIPEPRPKLLDLPLLFNGAVAVQLQVCHLNPGCTMPI